MSNTASSRVGSTTAPRTANHNHRGLSTADAQARLKQFGPNAVVEEKAHPLKAWNTRGILLAATVLAACKLVFSLGVFLCGDYLLRLDMPHLQTLMFATLILSSQAGVYLLRERRHFWQSQPSRFLVGGSVLGLTVTAVFALGGIARRQKKLLSGLLKTIRGTGCATSQRSLSLQTVEKPS